MHITLKAQHMALKTNHAKCRVQMMYLKNIIRILSKNIIATEKYIFFIFKKSVYIISSVKKNPIIKQFSHRMLTNVERLHLTRVHKKPAH